MEINKKEEYVSYKGLTSGNVEACFSKAKQYEERLCKDLSEWTATEIVEFYKSLCTPSVDFLYNIHCVYKAYTTWCLNENLVTDNINHYDEITLDTLMQCINKSMADNRIISRDNLIHEIQKFDNPRDKFLCLACFEGWAGKELEEIINAKLSNFNKSKHLVKVSEKRNIPYTDLLFNYAIEAANTYVYVIEAMNAKAAAIKERNYDMVGDADQVIKKVLSKDKTEDANAEVKPQVLYTKLKNIQRETNIPAFTSKALKESGRIHMIKEQIKDNPNINLEEAIKNTQEIYGKLLSISAYITKYKDFLIG